MGWWERADRVGDEQRGRVDPLWSEGASALGVPVEAVAIGGPPRPNGPCCPLTPRIDRRRWRTFAERCHPGAFNLLHAQASLTIDFLRACHRRQTTIFRLSCMRRSVMTCWITPASTLSSPSVKA